MSNGVDEAPVLTLFCGPNGSGKSTLAEYVFKRGDLIGYMLDADRMVGSPPHTGAQRFRAAKDVLKFSYEFIRGEISFSRESTLCSHEIFRTIEKAKNAGFKAEMHFIGISNLQISSGLVDDRVRRGGHDIPLPIQERRYDISYANAARMINRVDLVTFYDNSELEMQKVATVDFGRITVRKKNMPEWFDWVTKAHTSANDISKVDKVKLIQSLKTAKFGL